VNLTGSWRAELRKLLLVLAASAAIGWTTGLTVEGLCLGLAIVAGTWLFQLWKLRRWLENPDESPPESLGIWGLVYDTIYGLQRENRDARSRLQSTVDYLQSSFASMRDGVVILTQSGAIEWANASAERLIGLQYPRDQGQPILNLLRWPAFHDYFVKGEFQQPLQVPNAINPRQILQIEITTFAGGDFLIFARDVTKVVQMEQMRRDFVGNVSHELRTPLTVFKGYLDTFDSAGSLSPESLKRGLAQMSAQVSRMENLLADLLWLSRIESVREDRGSAPVNMAALIEELREELRSGFPDRLIVVNLHCRDTVIGDYSELRSAVSNLVINALKYSDDAQPVEIDWRREGSDLLLSVRDRGIGIDEQHIPRLTERFYRVDESRSTSTGGTGLGLAIVKHVAAAHRANLEVQSTPGIGSCFTIRFSEL
jgi:two-component system phosphate regulon sensor histidine kinase PhoR